MDIQEIINDVLKQVKTLATGEFDGLKNEISEDTKAFLNESKTKLEEWAKKLATGQYNEAKIKYLVGTQKDLLEMKALTAAGISAISIDNFRQKVLDVVVKVILKAVIP